MDDGSVQCSIRKWNLSRKLDQFLQFLDKKEMNTIGWSPSTEYLRTEDCFQILKTQDYPVGWDHWWKQWDCPGGVEVKCCVAIASFCFSSGLSSFYDIMKRVSISNLTGGFRCFDTNVLVRRNNSQMDHGWIINIVLCSIRIVHWIGWINVVTRNSEIHCDLLFWQQEIENSLQNEIN